jgi:uncharacterized protein (TIGR02246 family)
MKKWITAPIIAIILSFAFNPAKAMQADTVKDNQAIYQLIKDYENAWNRHDADALANCYHTDATWVNWFGAYSKDRADIKAHYQTVHSTYFKTSTYYTRAIEDLTFVKPDVAIVHVRTGLSGDTRYPGETFEFRRLIVVTKRDGQWRILAGQNAKLEKGIK